MEQEKIEETEVLWATTRYLASRGALPFCFSPPRGQGIDSSDFKSKIEEIYSLYGFKPEFRHSGPDIIAVSDSEYWAVECKGSGLGKPATQRNNFDRALASAVSYYEDQPTEMPDKYKTAKVYVGLALPNTKQYLKELRRRVRKPLRKKLNLWVLLYDPESEEVQGISPDGEYPSE